MLIPAIAALGFGLFSFQCNFSTLKAGDAACMCLVGFLLIPLAIFLIWSWMTTYYEIGDNKIGYRSGLFNGNIPISDINWIKRSSYPVGGSNPALAWDGLLINYRGNHELFISPQNLDDFIGQLSKSNSKIKIVKT